MDVGDSASALEELPACGSEVLGGSEIEREEWATLLREACHSADDAERAPLYRRAIEIAAAHGLPTLRLRLCLVRFLLDVAKPSAALEELRACEGEVPGGVDGERVWWAELFEEAGRSNLGR